MARPLDSGFSWSLPSKSTSTRSPRRSSSRTNRHAVIGSVTLSSSSVGGQPTRPSPLLVLADRLKKLVALGLLTREETCSGQRARYSLTEPAIQRVPVFAQLGSWDFATGPPAASCAFAPTCSTIRAPWLRELLVSNWVVAAPKS